MKYVVVTGGLGFIGSHLCRSILQGGTKLIIFDDLSNADKLSLDEFNEYDHFEFIQHDISSPLPDLNKDIDYIFNLAALVSVPDSFQNPLRTHQVNETGFINVLEFAKRHHVKKLVYASSCAVYGSCLNLPLKEIEPVIPESPYGLTKLNNERYAKYFHQANGLESVGLRFFNVFGPGQKPTSPYAGVISIFMDRAIKNEPITIYGDGSQIRDFVFVEDIVKAMIYASQSEIGCEVFNVGTGIPTSVNDLFKSISDITNYAGDPIYAPHRLGDVELSCSDPYKLESKTKYKPTTTIQDGLKALYESLKMS